MIIDDDLWSVVVVRPSVGDRPIMQQRYKNHDAAAAATRSKRINIGKINFVVCGWTDLQRHREEQNVQTSQIYLSSQALTKDIAHWGGASTHVGCGETNDKRDWDKRRHPANTSSLQRSFGAAEVAEPVIWFSAICASKISTMTWTVSRSHRRGEKSEGVIYTLSICSSSLARPVSPDHMGKMGLLKALFFCEPAAGPSARIPGHKPNLFLLLHLFLSSFLHISSETKDSMDGRRRKGV